VFCYNSHSLVKASKSATISTFQTISTRSETISKFQTRSASTSYLHSSLSLVVILGTVTHPRRAKFLFLFFCPHKNKSYLSMVLIWTIGKPARSSDQGSLILKPIDSLCDLDGLVMKLNTEPFSSLVQV
jgi:hypothetical protein